MLMEKARQEIADFGRKMSADGLSKGTSGNLSIYDPETGYMAIGPSGLGYFETEAEDVVVMTLDGKIVEGKRKPSSEHDLHAVFYRNKPDARAVVHTHSTYCTTF
ncbi:MAG: class II aldolase/adducin family protein, partial [Oscillospiraceae bacterium]